MKSVGVLLNAPGEDARIEELELDGPGRFEFGTQPGVAPARNALADKADGLTTVPQIWIGDLHVGGSDELHALDRTGKLDALLAG